MKELGVFGLADPRAVGRRRRVDAVLRAGHRGAGPRLDEPGRRDGRAHRRRQAAASRSAPTSSRSATCRGWRPASSGRRWRSPSPAAARTCRRCARRARRDGDEYVVNGAKTWITNARRSGLIALLCKTDPRRRARAPRHQHPAGRARARASTVSRDLPKLGYKGVETCELAFDDCRVPGRRRARRRRGRGLRADDARAGDRPDPGGRPRARRRRGPRSRTRCATPRSARRSASRSGSTSRSATTWPTWRRS